MRITVRLEDNLARRIRQLAGPRGMSRFIGDAVAEKVSREERKPDLERELIEGYIARSREAASDDDWEFVDRESWPEWRG